MNMQQARKIAVLGAGSWGTALAILLSRNGLQVMLWGHEESHVIALERDKENKAFLPGFNLSSLIVPIATIIAALDAVDDVLIAVPSHAFRSVLSTLIPDLPAHINVSWATKGFDPQYNLLLHQVAIELLGSQRNFAAISGPTFAQEVARGLPTAVTIAATNPNYAKYVANYLHSSYFRAYTSDDIVGVQVGGAVKNVLAIAAGIGDGLGFGSNTRAALITRGLAELTRLGVALGGNPRTFMGLAGLGDLALTCTDNQSRNRRLGMLLAQGLNVKQACREIGQEIEGVSTTKAVVLKAKELGIDMPISKQVYRILYEHIAPIEAVQALLERDTKRELD